MKRHELKILPQYFEEQLAKRKTFELRKHDRDFAVGDEIKLVEIDAKLCDEYRPTGRSLIVEITDILHSSHDAPFDGLEVGYSILSTRLL